MLVVVSTLLDPEKYDALELIDLYARRWDIEVKFRDVKATLGMEEFAVKSPAMAHKTLLMMMIAYNLLRCLMQRSAARGKPLVEMSFLDRPLLRGIANFNGDGTVFFSASIPIDLSDSDSLIKSDIADWMLASIYDSAALGTLLGTATGLINDVVDFVFPPAVFFNSSFRRHFVDPRLFPPRKISTDANYTKKH